MLRGAEAEIAFPTDPLLTAWFEIDSGQRDEQRGSDGGGGWRT